MVKLANFTSQGATINIVLVGNGERMYGARYLRYKLSVRDLVEMMLKAIVIHLVINVRRAFPSKAAFATRIALTATRLVTCVWSP
jgi:hypothetical protein